MNIDRSTCRIFAALIVSITLSCGANLARAVNTAPLSDASYADAEANIFLDDEITFVEVTMSPADLATMLADPHNDTYRECTVRVVNSRIDEMITSVGIRPRGNTSRDSLKKSWKLSFNEFVPGRRFHGLKKFNLNGEHNDVAITRSKLSWDMYAAMGVPAPRASHVHLIINDGSEVEGMHVNIEQINDDFLEAWFGSEEGNLYKCLYQGARADLRYVAPGTPQTYQHLGSNGVTQTYELQTNEETPDYSGLASFIDFVNNSSDAQFADEIVTRFSVDNFLRCMAADVVNGHWDNYWYGANNYYLYHNPNTNRLEYIPYDLDNTYGIDFFNIDWANRGYSSWGNGGYGSDGGNLPPLIERILNIPAYEQQYRRYLRYLVGAVGDVVNPSQTYIDTVGDTFLSVSDPHFDIASVTVSNDASNLIIELNVAGPVDVGGATDQGRFVFFFDTQSGGATDNPWARAINTAVNSDFFLGSWTDGGGGFILYDRNGSDTNWDLIHASFGDSGGISQDLSDKASGIVRYTIPLARLNLAINDTFDFDAVSTNDRGMGFEPGIDHLSNPAQPTPDYNTASTTGAYLTYTVQPVPPAPAVDGPFTLAARETDIDAIRTRLAPYAFTGSYSGPTMDYGFTNANFLDAYTLPASYVTNHPWDWGIKPYIAARTASLRATLTAPPALPNVWVNEILPFNCSINTDEAGDYDDWIELYNAGDDAVDLGGMYLTDDPGAPRKWMIPSGTSIAAQGYLLIWCDDELGEGALHASFKLAVGGEGVGLYDTDSNGNVLVDYLGYPTLVGDAAYGRYPDGEPNAEILTNVTPLAANDNGGGPPIPSGTAPKLYINEWMADNDATIEDPDDPGSFEDYVELYNDELFAIDLGGMHLTDDLSNPTQWEIPMGVSIAPKSYLVFWADEDLAEGPTHADFKLSKSGEEIGLFGSREDCLIEIDTVTFGAQTTDISEGRHADGRACVKVLSAPTPGASNVWIPGDTDDDGDIDLIDAAQFADCLDGPRQPSPASCGACVDFDIDNDNDVDLNDFATLQSAFTG